MGNSSKTGLSSVSNHLESILMGHCCRNDDTEFRKHFFLWKNHKSQLATYVTQDKFGDYPLNEYLFLYRLQYFQHLRNCSGVRNGQLLNYGKYLLVKCLLLWENKEIASHLSFNAVFSKTSFNTAQEKNTHSNPYIFIVTG